MSQDTERRFRLVRISHMGPKGSKPWVDRWNGRVYEIDPGGHLDIDEHVAWHWFGNPGLLGQEENAVDEKEERRVRTRRTLYKTEHIPSGDGMPSIDRKVNLPLPTEPGTPIGPMKWEVLPGKYGDRIEGSLKSYAEAVGGR